MKAVLRFIAVLIVGLATAGWAQMSGDQLGVHDMSPMGASSIKGGLGSACFYCHTPHGGNTSAGPLWNQSLSVQTYSDYTSTTYHQQAVQPALGNPTKLCLSCHDGSVAPGQTVSLGQLSMSGSMSTTANLGTDLRSSHPFSLKTPLVDSPEINALLFGAPPQTADAAVRLVNGSIECTTCHQPHFQAIDPIQQQFLVRESSAAKLCLACHDPNRVVSGRVNYLGGWQQSAHATAPNGTPNKPYVGGYATVAQNGCSSCHMPHNATGMARLLRAPDEQDCNSCHSGINTQPALANVFAEFSKRGHPFASGTNLHDRTEPALLNNNRHATCADCHNPHASQQVATFGQPPTIRVSQTGVVGISAVDGNTVINTAVDQYENCFRCHGESTGKVSDATKYGYLPRPVVAPPDPLNVRLQLSASYSSHPVTHDRNSVLPNPSLRSKMLNLDGTTLGRTIGTRIFCTDCHNSDDNRESGGSGANGPHGSTFTHILERRYEASQAASPGGVVSNLFPNPDLGPSGPYAMCAKCHDLSQILANTTFSRHGSHIANDGFSCSACHTSHGLGSTNANVSGERLVDFDMNVVGPVGTSPVSYNRTTRTCTLTCHGVAHNNSTY